ncbi:MAG: IspD/TarI family cytidylyltransferase, partial [Pseudomonadota bacterium]|nr:IspD/TarI family cytidylyltransferase [Pseudomonadota bacterium]
MDIILLAAGNSRRFQNSLPSGQKRQKKQFVRISGRSLIALCVDNLASCDVINKIMLVLPAAIDDDEMAEIDRLVLRYPNRLFTTVGGNERPDSVKNGLDALEQLTDISDFVAIHDCARPFVTEEILQRLFDALTSKPDSGVLPVLEIADTVKKQDNSSITTIDRRQLYRAQTPQCFLRREYRHALAEAEQADNLSAMTDDCSLYERTGRGITAVQGDRGLEKITTAHDL